MTTPTLPDWIREAQEADRAERRARYDAWARQAIPFAEATR